MKQPIVIEAERDGYPCGRLFTVREYYRLARARVLRPDERVELLEGEILVMSPQGPKHASFTTRAGDCFRGRLGRRAVVRIQAPIHLDDFSEPEPDVVLAIPDKSEYVDHHPTPREILLLMEISESSLSYDRGRKSRVYSRTGVIQYCVLNVKSRELEDHRNPGPEGYRSKQTYSEAQSFTLVAFPNVSIKVRDLLPSVKAAEKSKSRRK